MDNEPKIGHPTFLNDPVFLKTGMSPEWWKWMLAGQFACAMTQSNSNTEDIAWLATKAAEQLIEELKKGME